MAAINPADRLLNFNEPLDIALLDHTMELMSKQPTPEIQALLEQFRVHPMAWTRVDAILEKATRIETKFLGLNVLLITVKSRWYVLPAQQREGIRTFLVNFIIRLSKEPSRQPSDAQLLSKFNAVLVEVLKHEWPHRWPSFIPELVQSSRASESICANNMNILRLLSEEIFDYSADEMTTEKVKMMKKNLNHDFLAIYQLCEFILDNSQDRTLLTVTLQTLQRFLHWIPVGFIFETKLIETLAIKFFNLPPFRNETLLCLAEIGGLNLKDHPEYNPKFVSLYAAVTKSVANLLTPETDIVKIYASGNPQAELFVRNLTIFIASFLKSHLGLLESTNDTTRQVLQVSLTFLLRMSEVEDVVIFKICLECWSALVSDLYHSNRGVLQQTAPLMLGQMQKPAVPPRLQLYAPILTMLRRVMIGKMGKPEEVVVVEDDSTGDVIRETTKDTDAMTLYKSMRDAMIYLTHLDPLDTQEIMITKLTGLVDGRGFTHQNLNTLCWAIGSISGALAEAPEKAFLVKVIKDLLHLCEIKKGKDHKAIIASNIMYVVGQYPRFLRMHWKFLKTVVNKLFEFMHEKHPGVQDMSCDTFLKIATKCRRKFVTVQQGEASMRPYIDQMLDDLPNHIRDLAHSQIHTFYEAMACIIQSQTDPEKRQVLVMKLMQMPNSGWSGIIQAANSNLSSLWEPQTVKNVIWILKTNNRVASALGSGYTVQLSRIYLEMLHVYKLYSGFVSNEIAKLGDIATRTAVVVHMRAVKQEILKLLQCFIQNMPPSEQENVFKNFVPPLLEPVLDDYQRGVPGARDSEVLLLFSEIITKFGEAMMPCINKVFESTFAATLSMITGNFTDYPEHRLHFFKLLRSINTHAFRALLSLNAQQFQLVIDSIVWAFKHLERNIADTGLSTLYELIDKMHMSEFANQFYKTYLMNLLKDILGVLTDTFHKPGLQLQSQILAKLFQIVESGAVTVPLWNADQNFANNQTFVRAFVTNLISTSFQTVTPQQVDAFVLTLFSSCNDLNVFRSHIRDFLIQLKEFSARDNSDLFLEEEQKRSSDEQERIKTVPGLYKPSRAELAVPEDADEPNADMTDVL